MIESNVLGYFTMGWLEWRRHHYAAAVRECWWGVQEAVWATTHPHG